MKPLSLSTPTPTSVRIVRAFHAPAALVWRAHTDPELVKRWMTGPPGHSLPVCEIDLRVGGKARYVWKNSEFEMGMTAEFQEIVEPERIVHTEVFDEWEENPSTVKTTINEAEGETTLTIEIDYANQEGRDAVLEVGFEEGYEASFQHLDGLLEELRAGE